jgi:hypothetical protein
MPRLAGALPLLALLAMLAAPAPPARGEDNPRESMRLETAHGVLEVRPGRDEAECEAAGSSPWCALAILDGRVVFADFWVEVEGIMPSREEPRLVHITLDGGGNCCLPVDVLLDFTGPELVTLKEFGLRDAEVRGDGTLVLRKVDGENELGDPVVGVYAYVPGSGRPALLRKLVEYKPATIDKKTYLDAILADLDLRKPILDAMGTASFAAFRRDTGVQSPVSVLAGRYLSGGGCSPHDCLGAGGMFIIDRVRETAIVLRYDHDVISDRGEVRYWGRFDAMSQTEIDEVGAWLSTVRIDWANILPARD